MADDARGRRRAKQRGPWRDSGHQAGLRLGKIAGIALVISPSWLISAALIVFLATPIVRRVVPTATMPVAVAVSALLAILLGLSVLAHELGHCLVARLYRIKVREIRLYLVGGVSELERSPGAPGEEALIAAAGPAVSGVIAVLCWLLLPMQSVGTITWLVCLEMMVANGVVAAFNILPALPLDGGRVLRAGIWRLAGSERPGTIAGVIGGFLVAAALIVWAAFAVATASRAGFLQAAIVAVMAFFVAAGAAGEWPRRALGGRSLVGAGDSSAGFSGPRPVRLVDVREPIGTALRLPRNSVIVATGIDGTMAGVVDVTAAEVAALGPGEPVAAVLQPLIPAMVMLPTDSLPQARHRMHTLDLPYVVMMGDDGRPEAVLLPEDFPQGTVSHAHDDLGG